VGHADAILFILQRRGGWVSTSELLRDVPSIVHSRIADLRKRGHDIQHKTTGPGAAGSWYRLRTLSEEREPEPEADAAEPVIPAGVSLVRNDGDARSADTPPSRSSLSAPALRDWPAPTPFSPEAASGGGAGQLVLLQERRRPAWD
jgi:hypothetical protein